MEPSVYRLRDGDILTLCVLCLLGLGVIMVQSASINVGSRWAVAGQRDGRAATVNVEAFSRDGAIKNAKQAGLSEVASAQQTAGKWYWTGRASKHALFAGLAVVTFFVVGRIDYLKLVRARRWRSPAMYLLIAAGVACVLVLVPHVGIEKNGARRWLPLGITQVQPSELAKWTIVLFLAWWITFRQVDIRNFGRGLMQTLVVIAIICGLVVIHDFGTAALIGVCAMVMLVAGGARLWHLGLITPLALGAAVFFVHHEEYRWRRMTAFLDPWAAPQREGYHMIQSLLSFATGGIFGRGLGNGIQKLGYLPEDTTDFIFAVVCEELGLFGAILVVALYLGIIFVAWRIVRQRRDSFGRLLALGIGGMIGLQALINIAVATVSVPTKGLSLPLVSAGGSGLIITCAALGLLASICRHPHAAEEEEKVAAEWSLDSRELAVAL